MYNNKYNAVYDISWVNEPTDRLAFLQAMRLLMRVEKK